MKNPREKKSLQKIHIKIRNEGKRLKGCYESGKHKTSTIYNKLAIISAFLFVRGVHKLCLANSANIYSQNETKIE